MNTPKKSANQFFAESPSSLVKGSKISSGKLTISATNAKNEFASLLETVLRGGQVVITKHDQPKAVLIGLDDFNALSRGSEVMLDTLSGEFDALLARMQTPEARAGMQAAMEASPEELGKAAVRAARKRG